MCTPFHLRGDLNIFGGENTCKKTVIRLDIREIDYVD
jgi:hypothetical protein